jgi:23S rRNA pseudouridine1911/1915/1917 synthase
VCGELARESGEIRVAIARHPSHRKRMTARDDDSGRAAHTSYRVLERLNSATFAEVQIHTGRTHQVRVHFQFLGHPLVGDAIYGARPNARLKELTDYAAPRVMLHARELSFIHPRTEEEMSFEAPLPKDFREALKVLRRES